MKSKFYISLFGWIVMTQCNPEKTERPVYIANPAIDKLTSLDVKMGEPQPGDWLDVHLEPGQTIQEYIEARPVAPTKKHNKIYLQPIGNFSALENKLVSNTAEYLRLFFELEVVILPIESDAIIPDSARRKTEIGEQFLTGFILNHLQNSMPNDAIVIMAITPTDLYPSANFNFVFGQAATKNRVAVSSFNRFKENALDSTNYTLCLNRLIKTSSHEISHMFTCLHCTYAVCVMNGSNSLWESDSRPNRLCSECLRKLQWNLGFDVKTRLEGIRKYFTNYKLERDYLLAAQDLTALN